MKRLILVAAAASLLVAGCSGGDDAATETSVKTVTESVTAAPATTTTRELATDLNGSEALYLAQVHSVTPSLTDNERIDYGYSTCQRLDEGKSLNDAVIALQVNYQVPRQEAALIAMSTPLYLCVEHKDRVRAEMQDLAGG